MPRGADLVYRCGKGHAESLPSSKYADELVLTPVDLIDRIAQLVPPPRTHRHRYYGVLAPNSPLRGAVTAMAQMPLPVPMPPAQPKPRPPAHYLWAALIARIYEVFPLICPNCGGQMRIIAFITKGKALGEGGRLGTGGLCIALGLIFRLLCPLLLCRWFLQKDRRRPVFAQHPYFVVADGLLCALFTVVALTTPSSSSKA